VQRRHAQRRRLLQDLARRLRPREADKQRQWRQRRGRWPPRKVELQTRGIDRPQRGLAPRPIHHPDIEGVARHPPQHRQHMHRARVIGRQRPAEFVGFEKDEIHGDARER
jgi:hypothetical protein